LQKFAINTLIMTIIAIAVGFLVVFAIYSNKAAVGQQADASSDYLIKQIEELEDDAASLEKQIIDTRSQIESLQTKQENSQTIISNEEKKLSNLNLMAGFTELTGPGIIITLDDNTEGAALAKKTNPSTYQPENFIVHDKDLLYIVKSLSNASEAVSINDIRLVDTSHIRCVGTVIMVNSTRVAPPYEIKIIGNADALENTLYECSRYKYLIQYDMPIKVEKTKDLTIPAYSGVYSAKYMQLVPQDDNE